MCSTFDRYKELSAKKERESLNLQETQELKEIIKWIEDNHTEE